jgi:hypothetical protein
VVIAKSGLPDGLKSRNNILPVFECLFEVIEESIGKTRVIVCDINPFNSEAD